MFGYSSCWFPDLFLAASLYPGMFSVLERGDVECWSLSLLCVCNWDLVQVTQLESNKVRSTVQQLATAIWEVYTPSGNVCKAIWSFILKKFLSKDSMMTSIKKMSFISVCSWNRWLRQWVLIDFSVLEVGTSKTKTSVCWGSSCFLVTKGWREREAIIPVSFVRAPIQLGVRWHLHALITSQRSLLSILSQLEWALM